VVGRRHEGAALEQARQDARELTLARQVDGQVVQPGVSPPHRRGRTRVEREQGLLGGAEEHRVAVVALELEPDEIAPERQRPIGVGHVEMDGAEGGELGARDRGGDVGGEDRGHVSSIRWAAAAAALLAEYR
jgi:hypothetical protein